MLSRLKFEIQPLVKQILDALPEMIWQSSTTTFLDPAMAGGQFLVEIQQRLRMAGHSDENISQRVWGCETNILRVNYAKNNKKLVSNHLFISDFLSHDWGDMKFDVIVGNPPYQSKEGNEGSTNSADLYAKFIDKCLEISRDYVALVVPSAWSGARDSKLKELLFERHQCSHFNTHGKKWFPVEMNTCWFITQKDRKGSTIVSDACNNSMELVLSRNSVITKNLRGLKLVSNLREWAAQGNLGNRWLRGKLNLNDLDGLGRGKTPFIKAVGTKEGQLDIQSIPKGAESCGLGLYKLVIPNVSSSDAIGNIKIATPEMVGGHSVVFLTGKNNQEVVKLKAYLESKLVQFLVASIKISTPNSKNLFELIPEMPVKWKTDQDLYLYFNLNNDEIAMIEKTD